MPAISFPGDYSDCGPLAASGNPYRIQVYDGSSTTSGSYVAYVQRLTAAAACESTPACTIDSVVESDLVALPNVTDGEVVSINVQNAPASSAGFNTVWRLLSSTGAPASLCGAFRSGFSDCGPLPASGNPYRIEVYDGSSNAVGSYVLSVNGVVVPCS